MSRTSSLHFDLFLCQIQQGCNFFIAFTFNVPQLHDKPLFFGKFVDQPIDDVHFFIMNHPIVRTVCIRFFLHFGGEFHVLSLFLLTPVYRKVLCHYQAIGFNRFKLRPLIPLAPHSYHGVLNDILGFCPIQGDSERQSKEFVLQRQNIVSEADFLHLYNNDGLGFEKLQSPTTFF